MLGSPNHPLQSVRRAFYSLSLTPTNYLDRAVVYPSGALTWYFYRKGISDLRLGTYPALSLAQAKALVLKHKSDEFTGENPDGQLTFKEYCNSAKFLREKNKTRKTNAESMEALNNRICPVIGHIRMDKITLDDINKFKFEI